MEFTKETRIASILIMSLYLIYGLFHIPFTQFLVSLAVGGIVFGITDCYEYAVLSILAMNFFYPLFGGPGSSVSKEGFMSGTASEVSERVKSIQKGTYESSSPEPSGVGSKLTEGFQDASGEDMTLNTNTAKTTAQVSTGQSTPAPTATSPAIPATSPPTPPSTISAQGVPPANQPAATVTTPVANPVPAAQQPAAQQPAAQQPAAQTAGFQDNSGLFKLGQIPVDQKGGFHIDAGTTVVNALSSLKPDQIKQMTADTRQLIETQKSLMGMLNSFQPMMQEGRQMMTTFQQMFSPTAGAAPPA